MRFVFWKLFSKEKATSSNLWYDRLFLCSGITGAALLFIAALSMIFIPKKINDFMVTGRSAH